MEDRNGQGMGNSNGIGYLIQHTDVLYRAGKGETSDRSLLQPLDFSCISTTETFETMSLSNNRLEVKDAFRSLKGLICTS